MQASSQFTKDKHLGTHTTVVKGNLGGGLHLHPGFSASLPTVDGLLHDPTLKNHLAQNGMKKKRGTVHMYSSTRLLCLKPKGIGLCVIQKGVKRCKICTMRGQDEGSEEAALKATHFCMKAALRANGHRKQDADDKPN
jgi:hypothetical protein